MLEKAYERLIFFGVCLRDWSRSRTRFYSHDRFRSFFINNNRWLTSRLLTPNHGKRVDGEDGAGEFIPDITLDFIPSVVTLRFRFEFSFVSPSPRATRLRTKDAFLSKLHQTDATDAAARPWEKGEIVREKEKEKEREKRRENHFIATLINHFLAEAK